MRRRPARSRPTSVPCANERLAAAPRRAGFVVDGDVHLEPGRRAAAPVVCRRSARRFVVTWSVSEVVARHARADRRSRGTRTTAAAERDLARAGARKAFEENGSRVDVDALLASCRASRVAAQVARVRDAEHDDALRDPRERVRRFRSTRTCVPSSGGSSSIARSMDGRSRALRSIKVRQYRPKWARRPGDRSRRRGRGQRADRPSLARRFETCGRWSLFAAMTVTIESRRGRTPKDAVGRVERLGRRRPAHAELPHDVTESGPRLVRFPRAFTVTRRVPRIATASRHRRALARRRRRSTRHTSSSSSAFQRVATRDPSPRQRVDRRRRARRALRRATCRLRTARGDRRNQRSRSSRRVLLGGPLFDHDEARPRDRRGRTRDSAPTRRARGGATDGSLSSSGGPVREVELSISLRRRPPRQQ